MPDWLVNGFSPVGLLVVVLQQIPGIIWAIHPPKVDPFSRNSGSPLVETLEKTFGIGTVVLLVIVLASFPVPQVLATACLIAAFLVLAAYFVFYTLYYRTITTWPILLGMAAFPPICFAFTALYQGNWPAIITSVIFGIVHVGLTRSNLGPGAQSDAEPARVSARR